MALAGLTGSQWVSAPPAIPHLLRSGPQSARARVQGTTQPAARGGAWRHVSYFAAAFLASAGPLGAARRWACRLSATRRRPTAVGTIGDVQFQVPVATMLREKPPTLGKRVGHKVERQQCPTHMEWLRAAAAAAAAAAGQAQDEEEMGVPSRRPRPEALEATKNVGFMFLKPHANTEASRNFIWEQLSQNYIEVVHEGEIDAERINSGRLIDRHYGSIAAKALDECPAELTVPADGAARFEECFGLTWKEAVSRSLVFNALEATERLGCSDLELDVKWMPLMLGEGKVKLASGCYCGLIEGIFVINGFYMGMREMYVERGSSVHWFSVEWDERDLPWEQFRSKILGATEPSRADENSLRGLAYQRWRELGLPREPDVGENVVHASASPFEALAERANWLGLAVKNDPFGRALLSRGISRDVIKHWAQDPMVHHDGRRQSLFDVFEGMDSAACLEVARALHAGPRHAVLGE